MAWCILSPFHTLSPTAFEPAEYGGFTLAGNAGNLRHLEPLFRREQHHLGTRPQPRRLGGAVQAVKEFTLRWRQWRYVDRSHTPNIPSFVETFVVVLR
jgi:hypothetical protein